MRFKKSPQLPGAGRTRAWHHHKSHTPTSPGAPNILAASVGTVKSRVSIRKSLLVSCNAHKVLEWMIIVSRKIECNWGRYWPSLLSPSPQCSATLHFYLLRYCANIKPKLNKSKKLVKDHQNYGFFLE